MGFKKRLLDGNVFHARHTKTVRTMVSLYGVEVIRRLKFSHMLEHLKCCVLGSKVIGQAACFNMEIVQWIVW